MRPFRAVGPFFQLHGFSISSGRRPPLAEESCDDVEDDLGAADEREPHAEAEDAARVGDELGRRRLDLPQVAAGVWILGGIKDQSRLLMGYLGDACSRVRTCRTCHSD